MNIIPAGCHADEMLSWWSLVLIVYAEANK